MSFLLDLVEVAQSHSGANLATVFAKILHDFGIGHKVSLLSFAYKIMTYYAQILGITCDNASANNVMIDALVELVAAFPGSVNRTRCFTHTLNLVVKVILRQFDVPKSGGDKNVVLKKLQDLAVDIEKEEAEMDERGDDEDDDNGKEEWFDDPRNLMSQEAEDELDLQVQPVRFVLVKVSLNSAHCSAVTER
jgi:hypothetical protein